MKQSKVARSFGKALLDLSVEQGILEKVKADMELVLATCKESRELQVVLNSPVVTEQKKKRILSDIFEGKVQSLTLAFLNLLAHKGRLNHVIDIAFTFDALYLNHKNILRTVIKSVDGVSATLKKKVEEMVKAGYQKEVLIEEQKDPSLIGGFVINIEDKQIDASVLKQLSILYNSFSENPYLSKI